MITRSVLMNEHIGMTIAVSNTMRISFSPETYITNKLEADLKSKGYYYRPSDIKLSRLPTANPTIDHVHASVVCGKPKRSILGLAGRID